MVDSALVQAITNEQDKQFDYELVQSLYLKACSEYFSDTDNLTGPWTHAVRSDIIDSIKKGKKASLSIYNLDKKLLSFCQPVLDNGEQKLVIKGTATEILCYEECFDVFVDLHKMTGHGDINAMQALMTDKFYINKKCLDYFLENCNVCDKYRKKRNPVVLNDHVIVEIHKAPHPDESCNYVLYYMDLATKFKLFKPLLSFCEDEVAIEMLKIFTDFGPPHRLETVHIEFFRSVLSKIAQGGFKYSISLYESKQLIGEPIIKDDVPENTHWATLCQLIQYDYNNNKQEENPMDKIFYSNDSKTYYSQKLNKEKIQENSHAETIIDLDDEGDDVDLNQDETDMLPKETVTASNVEKLINTIVDNSCETEYNTEVCDDDNCAFDNTETATNTAENVMLEDEVTTATNNLIRSMETIQDPPAEDTLDEAIISTDLIGNSDSVITDPTNVTCSVCNGKILTDFFCFYCETPTHIFCMKRVVYPVENITDPIVTNMYCDPCYDFLQLDITEMFAE